MCNGCVFSSSEFFVKLLCYSGVSVRIETGRYENTKDSSGNYSKLEKENRICQFCNLRMVEDEFNYLLK